MSWLPLILVRHAMPAVDRDVPSADWQLGDEGRRAARDLAARIPEAPTILSSDEAKAVQTAQQLATGGDEAIVTDSRLAEAQRPPGWKEDYRTIVRQYVAGLAVEGWEAQAAVVARFDAAVSDALDRAGERPCVLVTHGLAMTLWLQSRGALADPAADFWSQLRLPDAWSVALTPPAAHRLGE